MNKESAIAQQPGFAIWEEIVEDPRFRDLWWVEIDWTYNGMFVGEEPAEMLQQVKAYGAAFWALENGSNVDWLLNYEGGSFLLPASEALEQELRVRGVSYQTLGGGDTHLPAAAGAQLGMRKGQRQRPR